MPWGKKRWEYSSEEAEQVDERTRPEMNPKEPTRSEEYHRREEREPEDRTDMNPKKPESSEYVGKSRIQSLREKAGELRERSKEKQEERKEKKEVKKLEKEIEHPTYTRIKREAGEKIRHGGAVAERGAKHVYQKTEKAIGKTLTEIKEERKHKGQFPYGAPKVYTRPTRAHFGRAPSPIRQRPSVDYGRSEPSGFARMLGDEVSGMQRPQIDLLGSTEKREINLLRGNGNGKHNEFNLINSSGNGHKKEFSLIGGNGNSIRKNINLLGNNKKKIRLL